MSDFQSLGVAWSPTDGASVSLLRGLGANHPSQWGFSGPPGIWDGALGPIGRTLGGWLRPGGRPCASDIDVVSRAGLPLHQFADEATSALQSVVPFIAACVSTLDPATTMVSGARKLGELTGRNESDVVWSQIEYGADDPTAITAMLRAGQVAVSVHEATDGASSGRCASPSSSCPNYDFADEARRGLHRPRRSVGSCLPVPRATTHHFARRDRISRGGRAGLHPRHPYRPAGAAESSGYRARRSAAPPC